MNYTISEEILSQYNITLDEYLLLLFFSRGNKYSDVINSIKSKELAKNDLFSDGLIISNNIKDLLGTILVDSDKKVINKEDDFNNLAIKLREIYPQGKKAGSSYSWRDSVAVIARKLKILVVKYDFKFTEDQAIKATKKYVESFNGDYKYMQLLKYFLLKNLPEGEIKSEFMTIIETDGECDESNNDWTSTLK